MRVILLYHTLMLFILGSSCIAAEVPSGIPEKAEQASKLALGWSPDRVLVRIEVDIQEDPGGKTWRNQTIYRFGFYSSSKQQAIWIPDSGDVNLNGFPVPQEWSTECSIGQFDDLPQALQKAGNPIELSALSRATLSYINHRPEWQLKLRKSDETIVLSSGSVDREMQDWRLDGCITNYENKKYEQAFACMKKLAEEGLDAAQFNLALMYIHGEGVQKSIGEAEKWLELAAKQGYCPAGPLLAKVQLLNVIQAVKALDDFDKETGAYFQHGEASCKKGDYADAIRWYQKASDRGSKEADYKLGLLYYNGQGTSKDVSKGIQFMKNAAKSGSPEAKRFLQETGNAE